MRVKNRIFSALLIFAILGIILVTIVLSVNVSAIFGIENWGKKILFSSDLPLCSDNQTIMRLSSEKNAHGAIWNESNYSIQICYNSIFGKDYVIPAGEKVHDTNKNVIYLSDYKNAHGDVENLPWHIPVSYGDLICVSRTESCSANEKLVLSLSSSFNAHFAKNNSYSLKICCKSPQALTDCPSGTTRCSDGTCSATCQGTCALGQQLCIDGSCSTNCTLTDGGPQGCIGAPNGVCLAGREGCTCSDCYGEQDSCSSGLVCDVLKQTCQEFINPEIVIVKPEKSNNVNEWKKFTIDTQINFEQKSKASKDLKINWSFGDDTSQEIVNCLTSGNCNTTHLYSKSGHYTISALAKEQNGQKKATDFTDILVYKEGVNLFAIITSPEYGANLIDEEEVYFNANKSFIAKCNTNNCEAGKTCYEVGTDSGKLYCYDLPKPPVNYKFWFNWTFDPKTNHESNLIGNWNENYSKVVEFRKAFYTQGRHFASLKVGYESL